MPTRVSGTLVAGGVVTGLRWSPDSTRLAYVAEQDTDGVIELYVVNVSTTPAGAPVKVSGPLTAAGDVILATVSWAPSGDKLGYLADANTDALNELFVVSVPVSGMPGLAQRVNSTLPAASDVANRWQAGLALYVRAPPPRPLGSSVGGGQ